MRNPTVTSGGCIRPLSTNGPDDNAKRLALSSGPFVLEGLQGDYVLRFQIRLTADQCDLVDSEDPVCGVTIGIKGGMAGSAVVIGLLQGIDHSLAESLPALRVVGILRSRGRGQSFFDRLDQDIHRIKSRGAIKTRSAVSGGVILHELRSGGGLGGVWRRKREIARAAVVCDLLIEVRVADHAVATSKNLLLEGRDHHHLLLNNLATSDVDTTEIDCIGMMRSCSGQQIGVVGCACHSMALTINDGPAKLLELLHEIFGNDRAITRSVVDDKHCFEV